jgi:outer membrane protein assembly factor BamB
VLRFLRRPRVLIALAAIAVALAGGAVAAYLVATKKPGNVVNTDVPFEAPTTAATTPPPTTTKEKAAAKLRTVNWPRYGYTLAHTRVFEPPVVLNGPWRRVWVHRTGALTEFPPVIWRGVVFHLIDDGKLIVRTAKSGRLRWQRRLGALAASSPAVDRDTVYVTLLQGSGSATGKVMALRQEDGRILWSKTLPSRAESSPLLVGNRLYFGSENGTLYALDARSGRQLWTYHAAGAIKGSPSLHDGNLYFGNYGGDVQAVRASDGKLVWKSGAARGTLRSGNFYATAAVAFGRVYIGSTDGREYSLSAANGKLAWAHQTGAFIYSSAAVDNVPGLGPTVFVGSYDGYFYALDARDGSVRWRYAAGGKISGSPTVVGGIVYFANLAARQTIGLSTATGRVHFRRTTGSFDPIVSDGQWLYLTGSSSLTALRQVTAQGAAHGAKAARVNARTAAKAKRAKARAAARAKAAKAAKAKATRARARAAKRRAVRAKAAKARARKRRAARSSSG